MSSADMSQKYRVILNEADENITRLEKYIQKNPKALPEKRGI